MGAGHLAPLTSCGTDIRDDEKVCLSSGLCSMSWRSIASCQFLSQFSLHSHICLNWFGNWWKYWRRIPLLEWWGTFSHLWIPLLLRLWFTSCSLKYMTCLGCLEHFFLCTAVLCILHSSVVQLVTTVILCYNWLAVLPPDVGLLLLPHPIAQCRRVSGVLLIFLKLRCGLFGKTTNEAYVKLHFVVSSDLQNIIL